jgi:small-conductance mechanosensitive channel
VRFNVDHVQAWLDKNGGALITGGVVRRLIRTATDGSVPVLLRPLRERARGTRFEPSPLLTERRRQRAETLGSVLRSMASFGVAFIAGLMVLSQVGLDLTPIVASAGIIGVAVGFGAQNLVKDFLTGMFMLLEDQYGVGDVIDAGPAVGTVEAVPLRTTRLRDVEGTVWHIRNGEIARIGNKSQGWARALLDVPLDLATDIGQARELALSVAQSIADDEAFAGKVVEPPEVWGLESIGADGLVLRVTMKTAPLEQWPVERELRERLMVAFLREGILLGVPQRAVRNLDAT